MWKPIPDWEDRYAVNEQGEVKNIKTNRYLNGDINTAGYYRVSLYRNGKYIKFFRHRLVAQLFIDNPLNLPEVNHIDGDKSNNCVENLEWSDRAHNEHEARRTGLKEYKPFKVVYYNGQEEFYEFVPQFSQKLGLTNGAIRDYLKGRSKGYLNFGIKEIKYI